jgi:hypothetical protein
MVVLSCCGSSSRRVSAWETEIRLTARRSSVPAVYLSFMDVVGQSLWIDSLLSPQPPHKNEAGPIHFQEFYMVVASDCDEQQVSAWETEICSASIASVPTAVDSFQDDGFRLGSSCMFLNPQNIISLARTNKSI